MSITESELLHACRYAIGMMIENGSYNKGTKRKGLIKMKVKVAYKNMKGGKNNG